MKYYLSFWSIQIGTIYNKFKIIYIPSPIIFIKSNEHPLLLREHPWVPWKIHTIPPKVVLTKQT